MRGDMITIYKIFSDTDRIDRGRHFIRELEQENMDSNYTLKRATGICENTFSRKEGSGIKV